ncbi:MAG: ABC transporter ATP-binding protein [Desulfobacteraceae bacterium]|nr:ABC transporter ATP-binding protein [Desulfobacteraceae bacterium]
MKSINLIKPYVIKDRVPIVIGLFSLVLIDFLQLFIPRIIKWAVDDLTALQIDLKGLAVYALYIVGIAFIMGVFRYIWRYCLIGMSRRVELGVRNRLFEHIQILSASYFDKTKTGDLMAHATSDIQQIRMATGMGMVAMTDAIVLGAAAIGFMLYINVRLTFYVLIPMPLIVFSTRFISKRMHLLYKDVQGSFSNLTEAARERFEGIRIIKAYNREEESLSGLEKISKGHIDKSMNLVKRTGVFFPIMTFFTNMSLAIVLWLGGRHTVLFTITPGDFVAFISYLGILTWPMMAMGWVVSLIQRGKASLDRINIILETQPEIKNSSAPQSVGQFNDRIIFENVTFCYDPNGKHPVLSNIGFQLNKGKTLGIVGPPGGGKTTVLNLLPRIFDVSEGQILIDSTDIQEIQLEELRLLISFVPQEPFLFAGTIRENITFGNEAVNDSQLISAVEAASFYDTVKSLPNGFETIVGEKGVILSGGQKQRVALARALLRESPILILDDPVSQVDMETGNTIINTVRSMAGHRTIIIVSHRISAVRFADNIITLKNGGIVESGTHEELLQYDDNYYAKSFRLQEIEETLM